MEVHLLAIQARILLWVGLGLLAGGLWLGIAPGTMAWRAAVAAALAMWACRWLLHRIAGVIEERMAADMAERQLVEEKAQHEAAQAELAAKAEAVRASKTPPGRPAPRPAPVAR